MKNKLLLLCIGIVVNFHSYSQWTDITSSIGGGLTSTTNMAKPYVFDLNNDNYPDFLVPVLTTVASPYTKYWRLYKNNGNSTFTDVTTSYGLPTNLTSTLGFIDYNGDGFKDLYFYTATGLQILKNNNGTSFTDVSTQLGIASAFFISGEITSSLKVFDYDVDGDEDLLYTRTVSGVNTLTAIVNNGISFSTKVNIINSIPGATTGGINFSFFDMDNDGDFDIVFDAFSGTSQYSNGITTLYRKDATGYINTTSSSGLVNGLPGEISTIDINQDGNLDIVKGGADCCSSPLYRVFIGNGTGVFTEQTSTFSINNGAYKYSGTLTDFDNDTDFDFSWSSYTSTGAAPFRLYVNNGSNVFAENATTYGLNLGVTSGGVPIDDNGNGVWMDIDKDGDLDIILNRQGEGSTSTTGNVWVKRNPIQGNYINIKLNGCGVNKSGIGAKIKLVVGTNTKWLYYEKSPDGNITNGTDTFHFGLGTATLINSITVYWPNNTTTVLNNVTGNQFLTIGGGAGGSSAPTGSTAQTFCSGSTVANLTATGTNIQWYATSTGGTALASTTALVNGTTYYASQTVSGCESTLRLAVTVTLNPLPNATISGTTTVCAGSNAMVTFTGTPYATVTYTENWGALQTIVLNASGTASLITFFLTDSIYTLVSVTSNGCTQPLSESAFIYVNPLPTATISGTTTVCKDSVSANITFTGANGGAPYTFTYNINGGAYQTITTSFGNSVTLFVPTNTVGLFNYQLISVISGFYGCSQLQTGTSTVTVSSTAAPTGSSSQTLCSGSTVANLTATGTNIQWYATSTGGTALASTTTLVSGTTYYASQTVNGCESTTRLVVTVSLNNPTVSASSTTVCSGQPTTLTASSGASTSSNFSVGSIGPSGGYVFYDQGSVINGWRYLETSPTDNGSNSGTGCYCVSIPNTSTAIGTGRTNTTNWVGAGCNGGFINTATTFSINGNTNWFIPSKDELNLMYSTLKLNNLGNFQNVQYWTSSPASYGSCGIDGGAWVQNFTNGTQYSDYRAGYQGAGNLRLVRQFATGTPFSSYLWSTGATTASINVTPTSTTQYWVDVTTNGVTCRKFITITVNSTTPAPSGSTAQTFCSGSTVANLTATGTNIKWYATSTGGTALASTTALLNGTTYYASQTVSGCESTTRLVVTVSLNNPTVSASSTTVCSGQPTTLTASSGASTSSNFSVGSIGPSGGYVFYDKGSVTNGWRYLEAAPSNIQNSSWGCGDVNISGATSLAIGSGLTNTNAIVATCTTPSIAAKRCLDHTVNGYDDWYLPSQNEFAQIYQNLIVNNLGNFNVGPIPSLGTLYWTSTQLTAASGSHCCLECGGNFYQYSKVYELYVRPIRQFATGTPFSTYLWSTGAPTASINVTPTSTTQYWVDVTTNGVTCRKFITITVNSTTPAPSGSTTQTFCSGSTVANLTATGTNIKWYATSTGGTALASTTALVNGTTYYASQTTNGCESTTRLAVTVTLNNPTVSASSTTVCSGQPTTLTATDGNTQQPLDNKIAQFSNNVSNSIALNYPSQVPTSNFSYDFWFNTSRTITLLSEKTGGVNVQAVNGQNFVIFPSQPRGSGISVGTNGIAVIEHSPNFFDSRFTQQINLTGWHHCAVVYTSNNFSIYIDGILIGTRNNGSNFGGFGNTYSNVTLTQSIGEGYPGFDTNDNYTGKIDEFRQWKVSLTANQVQQIFNRKLLSNNMSECNVNLMFDQSNISNSSTVLSSVSISNTNLTSFSTDNSFLIGGFTGTSINNITNTNFSGTSSSTYSWSTGATTSSINVNPTTTTQYWVDVTTNGVTCRKNITITVNSTPSPTGANNQTMIQGSTIANLVVTGQNIIWYSTPFGGSPLPANTPLVNGVTYYASQTINGCESQFRLPVIVQVTLSNNEFDSINIVYYPNPVIDLLNIKASTELKSAKICNLLGQTIFQQRFNSNEIQLNMSDFPTGTYFVIVESDDRKETFKILKK